MKLLDVHAHLGFDRFDEDLDSVVQRAKEAGMTLLITCGINPKENRKALKISEKYDIVKPSFGIYPIDAIADKIDDLEDDVLRDIEVFDLDKELSWIEENKDKCIAIGEVGLDYKIAPGTEEDQKKVFRKIIKLAKKLDKPLVIHSRKAEMDCLEMLEEEDYTNVVMHCFSGKKSMIRKGIEMGVYFSVPAVITRLEHFQMLAKMVPLEKILTETDAPFLGPIAGERNEPANVTYTIKEIAKIKGLGEEEVAKQIYKNAEELFKL